MILQLLNWQSKSQEPYICPWAKCMSFSKHSVEDGLSNNNNNDDKNKTTIAKKILFKISITKGLQTPNNLNITIHFQDKLFNLQPDKLLKYTFFCQKRRRSMLTFVLHHLSLN